MADNNSPLEYREISNSNNQIKTQMDVINAPEENGKELYTVLTNLDVKTKFVLKGYEVNIVGI